MLFTAAAVVAIALLLLLLLLLLYQFAIVKQLRAAQCAQEQQQLK